MSVIDTERLLAEISADSPCGEDLEYDPQFGEMERAAQGKPEQQFGDTIVPAEEPDWREVKRVGLELFGRAKDLRIAMLLTQALTHTDGIPGLRDGLALLQGLLDRYWDEVHPQLDPDDDNDPTLRLNTLMTLRDPDAMLRAVREAAILDVRGLGRYTLRDVEVANGMFQLPAGSEGETPSGAEIEGAAMAADIEELKAIEGAFAQAMEHLQAVEGGLMERVGSMNALDLADLTRLLRDGRKIVLDWLAQRGAGVEESAEEVAAEGGAPGQGTGGPRITGPVASREDVVKVLDSICDYYRRYEPSSPVPLLLKRAKRLVFKDFMEIIQDLAPDGLAQAELIKGHEETE